MSVNFKFSYESLLKDNKVKSDLFEKLKIWCVENRDIPNLTNEQICIILLACNNHLEYTKKCISAYYKVKKNGPELFDDRDPERTDIQHQMKALQYCILPVRTKDNSAIILHRLTDPTPSSYNMDVAMKILFMVFDAINYESPPDGLIVLFDMRFVGLMHLTRIKLHCVRLFFQYLQEALPIKLSEIHVFNVVWFFDKIMAIIKPLMKSELFEKLHLHPSSYNMEEFYEKWVPKEYLPSDLGGDLPPTDVLHEETNKRLIELKTFFKEEEDQRKNMLNNNY